jgi:hypothetical protein
MDERLRPQIDYMADCVYSADSIRYRKMNSKVMEHKMQIPLTNLLKFPWISYKNLDTKLHFCLLKVKIKTSNSSRSYSRRHSLSCTACV